MEKDRPVHVVVLGAGFGGLTFCQTFQHPRARITLIDRQNHHLFQPLLYQVATAGLSAPEIAQPIRSILRHRADIEVLLDEVVDILPAERRVVTRGTAFEYDYLVVALGGRTSYFGHPEWEQFAPGLKSLDDAQHIRRKLLLAFERAESTEDAAEERRLMTTVIVGGGPTGVELAGAIAELTHVILSGDFRRIDPRHARCVLVQSGPRLLNEYPEALSQNAREALEKMGVEVRTEARVQNITRGCVDLGTEKIEAETIIWAAGVAASPLAAKLGTPVDRGGRLKPQPDLSLTGRPEVFLIGDLVSMTDKDGQVVPGIAPAAMQAAKHAAQVMMAELDGDPEARQPFDYWDKGTMATIGRSMAVVSFRGLQLTGFIAWLAWLFVHLLFLSGFRNRAAVLLQWTYSYFAFKRGARIITGMNDKSYGRTPPAEPSACAPSETSST